MDLPEDLEEGTADLSAQVSELAERIETLESERARTINYQACFHIVGTLRRAAVAAGVNVEWEKLADVLDDVAEGDATLCQSEAEMCQWDAPEERFQGQRIVNEMVKKERELAPWIIQLLRNVE
ncbi:hypothetical protein [Zavarzinella formosa]|uniref:hypothetical protein n=1 Tax=Zavarzinella formosa TaxID=360055 RepID=UPI0002E05F49|nr:hypothetical protein [Zavarzinella formosa]